MTTRRELLKASAAVSAAATFAALGSNFAHAAGSEKIRVGLIGCGSRGTGAAGDSAKSDPAVQIVALGDLFKDRLDKSRARLKGDGEKNPGIGEQYQVKDDMCFVGFDAYKQVIDSEVDLVLLCEPPGFRPSHYQYAIEKGKHVFFEKPVAVDAVGVRKIIETSEIAQKKNLGVVAGTVFRHHLPHIETIGKIHQGVIGEVLGGTSYYNATELWKHERQPDWTDAEWQIRNWLYFTWLSGDHIVEQAIHRIDIQNWVMKSVPVSAYGMGGRQKRVDPMFGNVYDHFTVEYEYPGGKKVTHMCRQQDGTDTRITEFYTGSKGIAEPSKGIVGQEPAEEEPLTKGYVREHKDLIDSIKANKPLNEGKQVAETTLTAIMGRMSAYTGKLVTWEQAMASQQDLWPGKIEFGPMAVAPIAIPGKDQLI